MNMCIYIQRKRWTHKNKDIKNTRSQDINRWIDHFPPLRKFRPPKCLGSVSFNWSSRNRNCVLARKLENRRRSVGMVGILHGFDASSHWRTAPWLFWLSWKGSCSTEWWWGMGGRKMRNGCNSLDEAQASSSWKTVWISFSTEQVSIGKWLFPSLKVWCSCGTYWQSLERNVGQEGQDCGFVVFVVCLVKHLKKRYYIYIYMIVLWIRSSIPQHIFSPLPKHTMHFCLLVAKLELFPPSVNYIFSMWRRSHDRVDAWKWISSFPSS